MSNVWFQKIPIPTPRRAIGNFKGEGGSQKAKFFNESMNENKKFPKRLGEKVQTKKSP